MSKIRDKSATRWDLDRIFETLDYPKPLPGKITFADVDFEIEINRHFLVLEGKRARRVAGILIYLDDLSQGQRIAMDSRYMDGRTCVIFYGNPDTGEIFEMQIWPNKKEPATPKKLWDFCNQWARWAKNQNPRKLDLVIFLSFAENSRG